MRPSENLGPPISLRLPSTDYSREGGQHSSPTVGGEAEAELRAPKYGHLLGVVGRWVCPLPPGPREGLQDGAASPRDSSITVHVCLTFAPGHSRQMRRQPECWGVQECVCMCVLCLSKVCSLSTHVVCTPLCVCKCLPASMCGCQCPFKVCVDGQTICISVTDFPHL